MTTRGRFIKPGTLHFSYSLEHSSEASGLFYSKLAFGESLSAMMAGSAVPDTSRRRMFSSSPVVLMKLIATYKIAMLGWDGNVLLRNFKNVIDQRD